MAAKRGAAGIKGQILFMLILSGREETMDQL
jgi:hypothetical protein